MAENLIVEVQFGDVDAAIRRMKKIAERTSLFKDMKRHEHYEPPSVRRRNKAARARLKMRKRQATQRMWDELREDRREQRYVAKHPERTS